MKNLFNLIKLQYYSIYSMKKYLSIIIVVAIVMSIFDSTMIIISSGMLIMGLIYSTAVYEDKSKISYLIYSLPVKPEEFILSKYIYGVINTMLTILFSNTLFIVLKTLNIGNFKDLTLGSLTLSTFFIGLVITIIVLPIALIVGFEKGRFIMIFIALSPICFSSTISKSFSTLNVSITPIMATILLILIIITLTLISYFVTSNLYATKDVN
ncbi:ABC-2 transporter permease [Clostridium uliginosum]|uniref:ABC-2 family transporter protein n=1 Tax=Clostridium uliginosum TaxID=119641 RepID=A0A1I1JRJ5_9CLOT|nr:ABC-2 transporter permease [Clostridium uliginosum]SFC51116.1 ABC-2 family transporter protein [Clostridium uliginosum]